MIRWIFASTVGKHGDELKIANYVKNQGSDAKYDQLYNSDRLTMFEWYYMIPRHLGRGCSLRNLHIIDKDRSRAFSGT